MVDPHCGHISEGGGRPTSSSHHLGGKHAPPLSVYLLDISKSSLFSLTIRCDIDNDNGMDTIYRYIEKNRYIDPSPTYCLPVFVRRPTTTESICCGTVALHKKMNCGQVKSDGSPSRIDGDKIRAEMSRVARVKKYSTKRRRRKRRHKSTAGRYWRVIECRLRWRSAPGSETWPTIVNHSYRQLSVQCCSSASIQLAPKLH